MAKLLTCTGLILTFSLLDLASRVCAITTDARQPWTDSHDCYSEYLIIHLIIPFDYLIIE